MQRAFPNVLGVLLVAAAASGLTTAHALAASAPVQAPLLDPTHRQLIVVRASDWSSPVGELVRYERRDGAWAEVGAPVPVSLGKSGIAWGTGLHPPIAAADEPHKKEGDGRAVAGIFALGTAFGYGATPATGMRWAYRASTPNSHCVDDGASPHYNRLVEVGDAAVPTVSWRSSEKMLRKDHLYRWGIVVEHNSTPAPRSGGGSCIFLHVWRAPQKPTLGCTAMEEAQLLEVLSWLDPAAKPLLVQLPRGVEARARSAWGLPGN